jgi:HindVP restriction endonuclease
MLIENKPGLYGINNTNRDFTKPESWGKNQFNSSFPAALVCYATSKGIDPIYLIINEKLDVIHSRITGKELFNTNPIHNRTFYAFESIYTPFESMVTGRLPRIDLVVGEFDENGLIIGKRGLEIKLTALPDNQTYLDSEDRYGSEIVVRPDTIVYLALSFATSYSLNREELKYILYNPSIKITDWRRASEVLPNLQAICESLEKVLKSLVDLQKPILLQPIWKTQGKSPRLADNCLDIFVWSELAFSKLFLEQTKEAIIRNPAVINRTMRTTVWLYKMLLDFAHEGKFDHKKIIDELTYDTKNDKAFALGGAITRKYMSCQQTLCPRIKKLEIKNIILNGGEKYLSPERRFDAAILATSELFI